MTRQRLFLDMSCVDAARDRIRHVYDTFDTVCVQFSGGKDSTAVLYLAKEVHDERGLGPVRVIFRDEEMVSPSVVRFLEEVRNYDWVEMEWYCLPMATEVWVLGRREYCLLWSAARERAGRLVRGIPDYAITAEHFGLTRDEPIPEAVDYYTMQGKVGRTAFIMGVRANESMLRYRSCVQKLHENYITAPYKLNRNIPLRFAKPIYDWTTDDVLKFVTEEHRGTYCEYYDLAALVGGNTRVGIPLHSVAARRLADIIETEPEFYDRLAECFPHIEAQRRLWKDFDIEGLIGSYSRAGWNGVRQCIADNMITSDMHKRAMAYAAAFRKKHVVDPRGYPIHLLVRTLLLNEFHATAINPIGPKTKAYNISMSEE
jgi:predicted phosphoadenosine phosphosulfate sulfurtransferase